MSRKQKILIFFLIFYILFFIFNINFAYSKEFDLYFFWGGGCPYSANIGQALREIKPQYPELNIVMVEVWYDFGGSRLLAAMAEGYSVKPESVPIVFVGDRVIEGGGHSEINRIREAVRFCSIAGCPSPLERVEIAKNKIEFNWKNIIIFVGVISFLFLFINLLKTKKETR